MVSNAKLIYIKIIRILNDIMNPISPLIQTRTLAFWAGGPLDAFHTRSTMKITASNWTRWCGECSQLRSIPYPHTAKPDVHIRPRVSTHTDVHMNSQSLDLYNTTVG